MDPIAAARYGMLAASQRLEASAGRIAGGEVDLGREIPELVGAKQAFKAQVQVAEVADEMWRALLEVQAKAA